MPNVFENSATPIEDLHLTKSPPVAGNINEGSFSAVQEFVEPGGLDGDGRDGLQPDHRTTFYWVSEARRS